MSSGDTSGPPKWEQFEESEAGQPEAPPSVIPTTTADAIVVDPARLLDAHGIRLDSVEEVAEVSVTAHEERNPQSRNGPASASASAANPSPPIDPYAPHRTNTETSHTGFKNGRIISAVFPENTTMAWVVPARFNPYSMPKSLADDRLTMPAEDYVLAMEMITNDYRFRCYCMFYSRLMAFWISLSVFVLVVVLLSQPNGGLSVFIFTLVWILFLIVGVFCVLIIRKHMLIGLRHCVQSANKLLMKNDMLVGVEDRGQLSCHKIAIIFMYIRTSECLPDVERLIRQRNAAAQPKVIEMSEREVNEVATHLVLKYSQNFVKETSKKRLLFPSRPVEGVSEFSPKHCATSYCLCQYIQKNHFGRRPRTWIERIL